MRYTLKQKLFTIGGDSRIQDEHGKDLYNVDGKAISIGRRLLIKDMRGRKLATIQQQVVALTPTFEVHVEGGTSARVSMKLLTLLDRLKIDVPGWDDLEARGDLLNHEYAIVRGSREVAHVSKRWIALVDSYGVEIDDDQDQVLLLGCAVIVDEILDMKERERAKD
jgi:uncharacterized protein YxjI